MPCFYVFCLFVYEGEEQDEDVLLVKEQDEDVWYKNQFAVFGKFFFPLAFSPNIQRSRATWYHTDPGRIDEGWRIRRESDRNFWQKFLPSVPNDTTETTKLNYEINLLCKKFVAGRIS